MSFLTIAQESLKETRKLLKPSLKSGNKKYEPSYFQQWTATKEQKAKWDRRNENQVKVDDLLSKQVLPVTIKGMTTLKAGEALYNKAVADPNQWYGNCAEQSLIAFYLCTHLKEKPALNEVLWITYKKGNFEHQLVALINKGKNDPAAVCDPWMDIACLYDNYKDEADKKLVVWTGQGKRLPLADRIVGRNLEGVKWVEPSNAKLLGFAEFKYFIRYAKWDDIIP